MEKLPEDWLFATLSRIEEGQTRHAAEMRQGFDSIRKAQADHELDDARWKSRVEVLEEKQDERSTFSRGLHTTLIASGLLAVWEGIKHLSGWK